MPCDKIKVGASSLLWSHPISRLLIRHSICFQEEKWSTCFRFPGRLALRKEVTDEICASKMTCPFEVVRRYNTYVSPFCWSQFVSLQTILDSTLIGFFIYIFRWYVLQNFTASAGLEKRAGAFALLRKTNCLKCASSLSPSEDAQLNAGWMAIQGTHIRNKWTCRDNSSNSSKTIPAPAEESMTRQLGMNKLQVWPWLKLNMSKYQIGTGQLSRAEPLVGWSHERKHCHAD